MLFSLHRVWLLARKQWAENQQLYLLGPLALAGILGVVIVYNLLSSDGLTERSQETIFYFGLFITGGLFSTTILSQFSNKIKSIGALSLPASVTEKLVNALIYSFIVLPVVYLLIAIPVILTGFYIDTHWAGHYNELKQLESGTMWGVAGIYICLQTFVVFCSVIFRRYVIIKSALLIIVLGFGLQVINPFVAKIFIKDKMGKIEHATVDIKLNNWLTQTRIDQGTEKQTVFVGNMYPTLFSNIVFFGDSGGIRTYKGDEYTNGILNVHNPYHRVFALLLVLAVPFLWVITWFKLKEKQL